MKLNELFINNSYLKLKKFILSFISSLDANDFTP